MLALFASIAACGVVIAAGFGPSDDNGWYLYVAERILHGERLYVDWVDVNPPLVVWMTVPAVALAEMTGLSAGNALVAWIAVLVGGALTLFHWILARQRELGSRDRNFLVGVAAVLLFIVPGETYGQREHVAVAFMLPYFALSSAERIWPARPSPGIAALIGAIAGVGASYKPHFMLVVALVALCVALRERALGSLLRPENLGLGATVLGYGVLVGLFAPDFIELVSVWGPSYLRFAVQPRWAFFFGPVAPLIIVSAMVLLVPRARTYLARLQLLLVVAAAGFFAVAVIQAKGWAYQLLPALVCAALAAITALRLRGYAVSGASGGPALRFPATRLLIAAAVLCTVLQRSLDSWLAWQVRARFVPAFMPYLRPYAGTGSALFLSTDMMPAFPLINHAELKWGMRYPSLWMLGEALATGCNEEGGAPRIGRVSDVEALAIGHVADDIQRTRPDLLFILERSKSDRAGTSHCPSFVDLLSGHPVIVRELSKYARIGGLFGYGVYQRRGAVGHRQDHEAAQI